MSHKNAQSEVSIFGNGKYSAIMAESHAEAIRLLGFTETEAEVFALALGSDLGRINAQSKIEWGKLDKNGKLGMKELAKVKGVTMTHSIAISKTLSMLNECTKYAVSFENRTESGEKLPVFPSVKLSKPVSDWLKERVELREKEAAKEKNENKTPEKEEQKEAANA